MVPAHQLPAPAGRQSGIADARIRLLRNSRHTPECRARGCKTRLSQSRQKIPPRPQQRRSPLRRPFPAHRPRLRCVGRPVGAGPLRPSYRTEAALPAASATAATPPPGRAAAQSQSPPHRADPRCCRRLGGDYPSSDGVAVRHAPARCRRSASAGGTGDCLAATAATSNPAAGNRRLRGATCHGGPSGTAGACRAGRSGQTRICQRRATRPPSPAAPREPPGRPGRRPAAAAAPAVHAALPAPETARRPTLLLLPLARHAKFPTVAIQITTASAASFGTRLAAKFSSCTAASCRNRLRATARTSRVGPNFMPFSPVVTGPMLCTDAMPKS